MADNYLEKRMDDYARGRLTTRRSTHRAEACIRFAPQTVVILGLDESSAPIASRLVSCGCKVVFTAADGAPGQRMAQSTGARFYPCGPEGVASDMAARGEKADAVISVGCFLPSDAFGQTRRFTVGPEAGSDGSTIALKGAYAACAVLLPALIDPAVTLPPQTIKL